MTAGRRPPRPESRPTHSVGVVNQMKMLALVSLLVFQGCGAQAAAPTVQTCGADEVGVAPRCVSAPPAAPAPGKSWEITFSEEFNGADYDRTKLNPCFDWNHGGCTSSFNEGKETYRPEHVVVSEGTAKMIAAPLSPPAPDDACYEASCDYASGMLTTARPNVSDSHYPLPFTYGYVESRIRFPAIPGFFTAFWMVPTDPTFEYRTEIDIAEIIGSEPRTIYMTYAYDDRSRSFEVNKSNDNGACPESDYSNDWVRLGVNWQPDSISWYVDDVLCGEFTDARWIEDGPMQLILGLMVNTNWTRDVNSVLPSPPPAAKLEVDYIRIFQQH